MMLLTRRRAVLGVAACAVMASLLPASASSARVPGSFVGVQTWETPTDAEFQRMGRGGIGVYRFNIAWPVVEFTPGARNWTPYDEIVISASRAGLRLVPVLVGSPSNWASRASYPPRGEAGTRAFARFARDAVRRYGRGGAFWKTFTGIPYRPITDWQVWNEPNFRGWWNNRPSAREYVRFLARARSNIKSADRKARIVLAGLPETRLGIPLSRYLPALYRVRGAHRLFDVVAIHPYASGPKGTIAVVRQTRKTMKRNGDARKPIWLTEVGWATGGDVSSPTAKFKTSKRGQAARLRATFTQGSKLRRQLGIRLVVWFSWRDRAPVAGESNWWGINTGLFTAGGSPKPAWQALVGLTGGAVGSGPLNPPLPPPAPPTPPPSPPPGPEPDPEPCLLPPLC
jgi:hypothetical protein